MNSGDIAPVIPTEEGVRRFPHTQGYFPDLSAENDAPDFGLPCTCEPTCELRCAGECGCRAHDMAFVEFCDAAGLSGQDEPTVAESDALAMYKGRRGRMAD